MLGAVNCFHQTERPLDEAVRLAATYEEAGVGIAEIDADGRVLMAQRPEGKALAGLWEFPGGKVDPVDPELLGTAVVEESPTAVADVEQALVGELGRDPQRRPLLVVVTDGRATGARGGNALAEARAAAELLASTGTAAVVVDCESGPVRLGLAGALGTALGAETLRLEELAADALAATVRSARAA